MYRREHAWLEHMADFFQSPNALIVPGPYEAAPYEMILLVMQGDPADMAALMPPGVRPRGCLRPDLQLLREPRHHQPLG